MQCLLNRSRINIAMNRSNVVAFGASRFLADWVYIGVKLNRSPGITARQTPRELFNLSRHFLLPVQKQKDHGRQRVA